MPDVLCEVRAKDVEWHVNITTERFLSEYYMYQKDKLAKPYNLQRKHALSDMRVALDGKVLPRGSMLYEGYVTSMSCNI
jgi:hypothetical protein